MSDARVPLASCACGECFDCPDGWHWAPEDLPCACTADCAIADADTDDVDTPRRERRS
jgi:hypothetical protein